MTCLCLDRNNHQGWFGESFVNVLAAAAGLACTRMTPDCTGVDFDVSHPGEYGGEQFPEIKVQVKSWSAPVRSKKEPDCWSYPRLSQKRFNALAGPHRVPRFLFIVMVPEDRTKYAVADDRALTLSRAAYWVSLEGESRFMKPSCDLTRTVLIPMANLLTPETLVSLFGVPAMRRSA